MQRQEMFAPHDGPNTALAIDYSVRQRPFVPTEEVDIAEHPMLENSLSKFLIMFPRGETEEIPDFALQFTREFPLWKKREIERFSATSPVPTSLLEVVVNLQIQDVCRYLDEQYTEADKNLQMYSYLREVVVGARAIENGGIFQPYEEETIERFCRHALSKEEDDIEIKPAEIAILFREWQEETYKRFHSEGTKDSQQIAMMISNLTLDRIADVLFNEHASFVFEQQMLDNDMQDSTHLQSSIRQSGDIANIARRAAEINKSRYFWDEISQLSEGQMLADEVEDAMKKGRFPSQIDVLRRVLAEPSYVGIFMRNFLKTTLFFELADDVEKSANWLVSNFSLLHEESVDYRNGWIPLEDLEMCGKLSLSDYSIFAQLQVREAEHKKRMAQISNNIDMPEAEANVAYWSHIDEVLQRAVEIAIIND